VEPLKLRKKVFAGWAGPGAQEGGDYGARQKPHCSGGGQLQKWQTTWDLEKTVIQHLQLGL
jgi:hypothetical protein